MNEVRPLVWYDPETNERTIVGHCTVSPGGVVTCQMMGGVESLLDTAPSVVISIEQGQKAMPEPAHVTGYDDPFTHFTADSKLAERKPKPFEVSDREFKKRADEIREITRPAEIKFDPGKFGIPEPDEFALDNSVAQSILPSDPRGDLVEQRRQHEEASAAWERERLIERNRAREFEFKTDAQLFEIAFPVPADPEVIKAAMARVVVLRNEERIRLDGREPDKLDFYNLGRKIKREFPWMTQEFIREYERQRQDAEGEAVPHIPEDIPE